MKKHRFMKPEPIPLLFIAVALTVSIVLGVWQLQRLEWKNQLIKRTEAALVAPVLDDLPQDADNFGTYEYQRVRLHGSYDYDQTLRKIGRATNGFYLLTPYALTDGRVVIVNRGWAPKERVNIQDDSSEYIEGMIRTPQAARLFSPENDIKDNLWFTDDIGAMAKKTGYKLEPIVIELTAPQNAGNVPRVHETGYHLRNDHLGYAITWFLLALAGAVMFVIYYYRPIDEKKDEKKRDEEESA